MSRKLIDKITHSDILKCEIDKLSNTIQTQLELMQNLNADLAERDIIIDELKSQIKIQKDRITANELDVDKFKQTQKHMEDKVNEIDNRDLWTDRLIALENDRDEIIRISEEIKRQFLKADSERLKNAEIYNKSLIDTLNALRNEMENLWTEMSRFDLNAAASCRSDEEFDKRFIPINRYFGERGMALSMHLTSVADKPPSIVYDTADIIRTSALSLISDEIKERQVSGSVAELGVARGNFARVINAVFPDKILHLFDTFDSFPHKDIVIDIERGYTKIKQDAYAGIDITALLKQMPYPKQCVIHQGYFPDTTHGLENEQYCFVSVDCDLYNPIKAGLEYFYPRMAKGGCIFVHDYRSKYFRGVIEAVREYTKENEISYCVLPDNTGTAVIMK